MARRGCSGCGPTSGGPRVLTAQIFLVETSAGEYVEEWPSWHEARVSAKRLGDGHKARLIARRVDSPDWPARKCVGCS